MLRARNYFGREPTPTKRERREAERRGYLPYGVWTCADGREVLFNRSYKPLWERLDSNCTKSADPDEWVHWKKQSWFFKDATAPNWRAPRPDKAMRRCEKILEEFCEGRSIKPYIVSGDQ